AGMEVGTANANLFNAAGTTLSGATAVGMPAANTDSEPAPACVTFEKRKVCWPLSATVKEYRLVGVRAVEPRGVEARATVPRRRGTGLPRASTAVTVTEVLSPAAIWVGAETMKPTAPPVRLSKPGELNHAATWPFGLAGLPTRTSAVPLPSASTAATGLPPGSGSVDGYTKRP